ncbi:MAG TPA: tetratricopeptide repeat protein [Bryobacteraceae bacterium]|jgi:tetratricopeptide (TPR) repeat protein
MYAQAGSEIQQIESAESAVRRAPDSETARIALGTLYLKLGQNRRASETLAAYLKVHPNSPKTLRLLAAASLRQEDYTAAKNYAARARRLEPRDAPGVHLLAMACLGLQDAAGAAGLFREALVLDPDSVDTNFQLGLLYTKQHERLAEAIRLLEKAEARQPDLAGTHTALGSALLQSGRWREAARQLEEAVKLDPQSAESYYILADAYGRLGESDKAKSALAEFNTRSAGSADERAREMRSRSFYEEGTSLLTNTDRLDAAYDSFRKAVQAKPDFDAAYYRMAQVRYLQGDTAQAVTHIREALRLNALEPEYYFVLAKCLETADRPAALAAIQTAVKLHPGVADFEELLRNLENKRPE